MVNREALTYDPSRWHNTVHVFVLSAVVVAYPLFTFLTSNPAYFVTNGISPPMIYALIAVLCLVMPAMVSLALWSNAFLSDRLAKLAHLSVIAVFLTFYFLSIFSQMTVNKEELLPASSTILVAGLLAAIALHFYRTNKYVYHGLSFLAPLVVVFPTLFLTNDHMQKILEHHEQSRADGALVTLSNTPPIVMLVFDEFPLMDLLDAEGEVDVDRFPNFGAFAAESTWYRNATTVHDFTLKAIPAMLTGQFPMPGNVLPLASNYPNLIFNTLGDTYTFHTVERATMLSPNDPDSSAHSITQATTGQFTGDLFVMYCHAVLPPILTNKWVPIDDGIWGGLLAGRTLKPQGTTEGVEEWQAHRIAASADNHFNSLSKFLEEIDEYPVVTFHFIHMLLPHYPFIYLPSGKGYNHENWEDAKIHIDYTATDYHLHSQRRLHAHLLQAGLADKLLGDLIKSLKESGHFDDSLIIVLSDHGVAYKSKLDPRRVQRETFGFIGFVPLFIKYPNQQESAVDETNAQSIDIPPTILDVLGADSRPNYDGRSLVSGAQEVPPHKRIMNRFDTIIELSLDDAEELRQEAHEYYKASLYLDKPGSTLFQFGPRIDLLGMSADHIREEAIPATIDCPDAVNLQHVDTEAAYLPILIKG